MSIKIGINGFGRIGRCVLRALLTRNDDIEIVAINELCDIKTNAHLFKYDSVHGTFNGDVQAKENSLVINGKEIKMYACKNPAELPWGELGVDIVYESTGIFTSHEKASLHLQAGAKKVLISAPSKDPDITLTAGINLDKYDPAKHHIISNASCTTNCLAPVAKTLHEAFGIERGLMTTIHAYTNDQRTLDVAHSDLRRARAAALSQIPTKTGAAAAVGLVLPELNGKIDGFAIRVPTPNVSCVDFVCTVEKQATAETVNQALKAASETGLKGILGYSNEPLVSIDYNGSSYSSIVDSLTTKVIDGKMIKVLAWYDNETGFSNRMLDVTKVIASKM